jgi:predicted O-methyltransferase YrrM
VQKYNAARAVGIDINPDRIKEAQANLEQAGVGDRVRFLNEDLFEANIAEATVVTLYLLPSLNRKLLPKLLAELKPGTRIVSHAFDMGSWKPQETLKANGSTVYFWTIPAKGTPEYTAATKAADNH